VYLDESGNSGLNLNNSEQPVFLLCAMIVAEAKWHSLEAGLTTVLDTRLPTWRQSIHFEMHGADLRRGAGHFANLVPKDRIDFRDAWMKVGAENGVRLVARSVNKRKYAQRLVQTFGHGVMINPHVAAFALLSRCVATYLKSLAGSPLACLSATTTRKWQRMWRNQYGFFEFPKARSGFLKSSRRVFY
jgi:Protein of unknown function (DUF3800)